MVDQNKQLLGELLGNQPGELLVNTRDCQARAPPRCICHASPLHTGLPAQPRRATPLLTVSQSSHTSPHRIVMNTQDNTRKNHLSTDFSGLSWENTTSRSLSSCLYLQILGDPPGPQGDPPIAFLMVFGRKPTETLSYSRRPGHKHDHSNINIEHRASNKDITWLTRTSNYQENCQGINQENCQ